MAEETAIEWTDATWNPWHGCKKVSNGCLNCYMYREKRIYGQNPMAVVKSKTKFKDPLTAKFKEPKRVFTCSWSDFFIQEADEWRAEAWEIIRRTPHLTYQILTKRPERVLQHLPAGWPREFGHVWLGVSVENQQEADRRIPILCRIPSAVKFLSCEPLLGPINLNPPHPARGLRPFKLEALDWVIVGGESGPGARPMDLNWAVSIQEQCQVAGVSLFMKQLGGVGDKRSKLQDLPVYMRVRQFPCVKVTHAQPSENEK